MTLLTVHIKLAQISVVHKSYYFKKFSCVVYADGECGEINGPTLSYPSALPLTIIGHL